MAAYAQTSGFLKSIKDNLRLWNGLNNEIILEKILVLINTEFAAMASAGLAGYTVTTGLEATMEELMGNFSNDLNRQNMKSWIELLLVEFAAVETNGLSYTKTTAILRKLNECIDNTSNHTHVRILRDINDILNTELTAVAAAS